jgi:alkylation response protein AidB-like acyl-CoA dehydrogenase
MVARDRNEQFKLDCWEKCAAFGAQGMPIAPEYGGPQPGDSFLISVTERLGYADVCTCRSGLGPADRGNPKAGESAFEDTSIESCGHHH